jgi:hypothetical protein
LTDVGRALREAPSWPLIDKSFDADVFLAPQTAFLMAPGPTLGVRECGFRRVWTHRFVNGQRDFPVGGQLISSLADS